jgi:hypothetical protein
VLSAGGGGGITIGLCPVMYATTRAPVFTTLGAEFSGIFPSFYKIKQYNILFKT